MNNFASFCFGSYLGVAIYSPFCDLVTSGCLTMFYGERWGRRLGMMRRKWGIDLAIIQCWGSIPEISEPYWEAVKAANPEHILIHHDQWNPVRMGLDSRRRVAETTLGRKIKHPEQIDAILCGKWLYDIVRSAGHPFPAAFLSELGGTTRRFPRRQDLRAMHTRMIQEAVNAN